MGDIELYFYKLLHISKESTDSQKTDNPFREKGSLSEFARDIVVAVKTGNLDKIKPEETVLENSHQKETTGQNMVTLEQNQNNSVDQKASDNLKSSKEVKVEHTLVLSPRHSDIEHIIIPKEKMRPKLTCCVVS